METLELERGDSGVVTLTLNRPKKLNAINGPMWGELRAVFTDVAANDADRVLVVTGAGGNFCSGADLGDDRSTLERHHLKRMHDIHEVALALHQIPKPVIAKVNGVAAGAGLNLALGCDLIAASEKARFSEIFARRGLTIDFGGSWLLPRWVGIHKAKELALLADIVDAREAERLGLVNRVVPEEKLDAFVTDWAERLAAGPPLALHMTKRLLDAGLASSFSDALQAEGMAQTVNFGSEDTREAILSFLEKRTPRFRGK